MTATASRPRARGHTTALAIPGGALVIQLRSHAEPVQALLRFVEVAGIDHRAGEWRGALQRTRRVEVHGRRAEWGQLDRPAPAADRRRAELAPGAAHGLRAGVRRDDDPRRAP